MISLPKIQHIQKKLDEKTNRSSKKNLLVEPPKEQKDTLGRITTASQKNQPPIDPNQHLREQKNKSVEELLQEVVIYPVERLNLDRVFELLKKQAPNKSKDDQEFITKQDIAIILDKLGMKMLPSEIELMIWEMDEDLNGKIDKHEFDIMYKRCIDDQTGLEPKTLFNLVQFLMFDRGCRFKITEEDTYDLIYVRVVNLEALDKAVKVIFDGEKVRADGKVIEVTFQQFLEKRNKEVLNIRKNKADQKKLMRSSLVKEEEK